MEEGAGTLTVMVMATRMSQPLDGDTPRRCPTRPSTTATLRC